MSFPLVARKVAAAVALLFVGAGCSGGGPTAESAEAYILETFDNPAHYDEWDFLSPPWGDGQPPEVIRVAVDGDCAAAQIQVDDRGMDSVFLRFEDGSWTPQDLVTGGDAFASLNPEGEFCYIH